MVKSAATLIGAAAALVFASRMFSKTPVPSPSITCCEVPFNKIYPEPVCTAELLIWPDTFIVFPLSSRTQLFRINESVMLSVFCDPDNRKVSLPDLLISSLRRVSAAPKSNKKFCVPEPLNIVLLLPVVYVVPDLILKSPPTLRLSELLLNTPDASSKSFKMVSG